MSFKMSEEVQTIKVYNLLAYTREFIGAGDALIPPHTGLPANCTDIEPPDATDGKIAVFDKEKASWSLVEDHRGETVFNTESGSAVYISELGPLPAATTSIAPQGKYQKWDGTEWVKDEDAEKSAQIREAEAKKSNLMQNANDRISLLQDAFDLDLATDEEKSQLLVLKKYRVLLNRVDTSDPNWPDEV